VIALGSVQIKVPPDRFFGARASAPVELFVRPERLGISAPGEPGTMTGKIVAHTYHGGHVDLQIACRACGDGLLLVRSAGDHAMTRWPPGTEVGISIDAEDCAAFPVAW
jgi:putative spermidine/putrescine transport system ATP-binding protein